MYVGMYVRVNVCQLRIRALLLPQRGRRRSPRNSRGLFRQNDQIYVHGLLAGESAQSSGFQASPVRLVDSAATNP